MAGVPFGSLLPQSGLPQSRPLNKQIGGRAGQAPAGRTRPLSPAERKRERTSGTHSLNVSHRPYETWTLGVALAPRGWGPASPARNAEQASKSSSVRSVLLNLLRLWPSCTRSLSCTRMSAAAAHTGMWRSDHENCQDLKPQNIMLVDQVGGCSTCWHFVMSQACKRKTYKQN